jgi:hypothetical protein
MNIELISSVLAALSVMIALRIAWKKDRDGFKPRRLEILAAFLAGLSVLCGYEGISRKSAMENLPHELEREWLVLQETPIAYLELEVIAPTGLVRPALNEVARGANFTMAGLDIASDGTPVSDHIEFGSAFASTNASSQRRIGYPVLEVQGRKPGAPVRDENIKSVTCLASWSNGRVATNDQGNTPCSITVVYKLRNKDLTINSIGRASLITLTLKMPAKGACFGPCSIPFLFSIRAVVPLADKVNAPMIELSPMILRRTASSVSADGYDYTFSLSGKTLVDITKSIYMQSFGYHEPEHFAITKGWINSLYAALTKHHERMQLIDEVWSTAPEPSDETLLSAIPVQLRAGAVPMGNEEWCGFGDVLKVDRTSTTEQLCWYRFVIFKPLP